MLKKSIEEYTMMIKDFIDNSDGKLQFEIRDHFKGVIPANKVNKITSDFHNVNLYWSVEKKMPVGYIYKSLNDSV